MEEFSLKQQVKIAATGVEGVIIGIWESAYDEVSYNVRYYSTTNCRVESWMHADEIESIDAVAVEEEGD